jgi:hypothetical protein
MRKLLMTVLTLALILGSISVASAASGKVKLTDIADNANEEAIQVAYDLDIVTGTPEGTYEPEKAVNRAEFAALIVRALRIPDSALASYTGGSTFKDTAGYSWAVPYLAILQQRGIMKGDGYGNAMPGRTISPNEAVTMVLRTVGYTDNASVLVGQWPANYVALGQSLGLYARVGGEIEMNKASAAQMIYNVLTVQLVQVDANSTVKYLYDTNNVTQNLLIMNLNCEPTGQKIIDEYDVTASKINLLPYVGAYGELYRSKADKEVVAVTNVATQFLAGRFTYFTSGPNVGKVDKFQTVDGTNYNLSAAVPGSDRVSPEDWANQLNAKDSAGAAASTGNDRLTPYLSSVPSGSAIFLNGNSLSRTNPLSNDQCDRYFVYDEDSYRENQYAYLIVAVKVSGQTITDLRSVAIWDAESSVNGSEHFLYEAGQIEGKKFNGHDFPLDVNNEVDPSLYTLVGVDSLDDLAVDNVVYVYKNRAKQIVRIEVGTVTQSGTVTNVNATDKTRTIGGQTLYFSPYDGTGKAEVDTAGNEGTALLDLYYRIYGFRLGEASKGNFAVVTGTSKIDSDATGSFKDLQFKLFDKTGKEVVYSVKNPFMYIADTGAKYKVGHSSAPSLTSTESIAGVTAAAWSGSISSAFDVDRLVEYKLSGGKLSEIRLGPPIADTATPAGKVDEGAVVITIPNLGQKGLDSGTLVFVADDGEYSIGSVKDLSKKELTAGFDYIMGVGAASNFVKALIVSADNTGAQSVFVMINSISTSANEAGLYNTIKGLSFTDGRGATADEPFDYVNADLSVDTWAPIKFSVNENGVLRGAIALYEDDATAATAKNETITGAALVATEYLHGDVNGIFALNVTYGTYGGGWYTTTTGKTPDYVAPTGVTFAQGTVLYTWTGSVWVAKAPTKYNLSTTARYAFYKTDPGKPHNIIVQLP